MARYRTKYIFQGAQQQTPGLKSQTSLSQISDYFFASGKAPALVRALLGKPEGFTLPVGSLPTGSKPLAATIEISHPGGTAVTKTFGVDSLGELVAYAVANHDATLSSFGLSYNDGCLRAAGAVSGACDGVDATLKVLSLTAKATAAPNSPDVTFSIPSINYSFTSSNAASRSDAASQFTRDAKQNIDFKKLAQEAARDLAVANGADALLGNPNLLEGQLTRANLDLDTPSPALGETRKEGGGRTGRDLSPSGWVIGRRAGRLNAGPSAGYDIDAVAEYGFHLQEGSQARLKVSAPLTVIDYSHDGGTVVTGAVRLAYEQPLIRNRWVVEPSAAVGGLLRFEGSAQLRRPLFGGLLQPLQDRPGGPRPHRHRQRGDLLLDLRDPHQELLHAAHRQHRLPQRGRLPAAGRRADVQPAGDAQGQLHAHQHHRGPGLPRPLEVALSYGLGSREVAVRQRAEVIRIGATFAFGHDYTAGGIVFGYVF